MMISALLPVWRLERLSPYFYREVVHRVGLGQLLRQQSRTGRNDAFLAIEHPQFRFHHHPDRSHVGTEMGQGFEHEFFSRPRKVGRRRYATEMMAVDEVAGAVVDVLGAVLMHPV